MVSGALLGGFFPAAWMAVPELYVLSIVGTKPAHWSHTHWSLQEKPSLEKGTWRILDTRLRYLYSLTTWDQLRPCGHPHYNSKESSSLPGVRSRYQPASEHCCLLRKLNRLKLDALEAGLEVILGATRASHFSLCFVVGGCMVCWASQP